MLTVSFIFFHTIQPGFLDGRLIIHINEIDNYFPDTRIIQLRKKLIKLNREKSTKQKDFGRLFNIKL